MKPQDHALRKALVDVLETFDISFTDVNRNGTPTLSFQIGIFTHRFSYDSDTEDVPTVARKLHNLCLAGGLRPKRVLLSLPKKSQQKQPVDQSSAELSENKIEQPVESESLMAEQDSSSESLQQNSEAPANSRAPLNGLFVYAPKPEYAPAEVYVVEAVSDHIIMAGDRLIIPIHRPDLMVVMSPQDFEARYMPKNFVLPYEAKPSQRPEARRPEPIVISEPEPELEPEIEFEPPMNSVSDSDAEDDDEEYAPTPAVRLPEPTTINVARRPYANSEAPSFKPSQADDASTREHPKAIPGGRVVVNGITVAAQLGRILGGIRQAVIATGRPEVTANEAADFMPPSDRKQIGARIHPAVKDGWIKLRKSPNVTGYLYSMTPVGERAIKNVVAACYREVGLMVPPFIESGK